MRPRGRKCAQLSGHTDTVNSAAYSPDGKFIVTASGDQTARIWDAATGQEVRNLSGHATRSIRRRTVRTASSSSPPVTTRPPASGTRPRGRQCANSAATPTAVNSAAYSPDGKFIVTASEDQTARIWDAATGQEVRTLSGHTGAVNSAAYSPDGKFIVTASADQTARIWDAATGQAVRTTQRPHRLGQLGGLQSGRPVHRHRQ